MPQPDYDALSIRATDLLKGKTVDRIRLDGKEIVVQFTDGARLFADADPRTAPAFLNVSIT